MLSKSELRTQKLQNCEIICKLKIKNNSIVFCNDVLYFISHYQFS